MSRTLRALLFLMSLGLAGTHAGAQSYTIRALNPPSTGVDSFGSAISNSGVVVGYARVKDGRKFAVRWDSGSSAATTLVSQTGVDVRATGISDDGRISLTFESPNGSVQAGVWNNNAVTPLFLGTYAQGETAAMNRHGDIVGTVFSGTPGPGTTSRGVQWPNTNYNSFVELAPLHGWEDEWTNAGYAINDWAMTGGGSAGNLNTTIQGSMVWTPGGNWMYSVYKYESHHALANSVLDLDNYRYAVGVFNMLDENNVEVSRAYVWDNAPPGGGFPVWNEIGTLNGVGRSAALGVRCLSVNDPGEVYGWSDTTNDPNNPGTRAFRWTPGTGMKDLNEFLPASSGWILTQANDVNEAGEITGWGLLNNQKRAFRMSPVAIRKFTIRPDVVKGGQSTTGYIELLDNVTANTVVTVSGSPLDILPQTVTVPAGQKSVSFPIGTKPVKITADTYITATLNQSSAQVKLTLTP